MLTSDLEMSKAFEKGVPTVLALSASLATNPAEMTRVLQLLVDLMRCSAQVYDYTDGKGEIGKKNAKLMRACESGLNVIISKNNDYVTQLLTEKDKELSDEEIVKRDTEVIMGVLRWVADLKELGVVKPKFKLSLTQPTTKPAAPAAP